MISEYPNERAMSGRKVAREESIKYAHERYGNCKHCANDKSCADGGSCVSVQNPVTKVYGCFSIDCMFYHKNFVPKERVEDV